MHEYLYESKPFSCSLVIYWNIIFSDFSLPLPVPIPKFFSPVEKQSHFLSSENLEFDNIIFPDFSNKQKTFLHRIQFWQIIGKKSRAKVTSSLRKMNSEIYFHFIICQINIVMPHQKVNMILKVHCRPDQTQIRP